MKTIKRIFFILLIILLIGIGIVIGKDNTELVHLRFLLYKTPYMPFGAMIILVFFCGFILGWLISRIRVWQLQWKIARLENKKN